MKLQRPQIWRSERGLADYFYIRKKSIFVRIAGLQSNDVLYDLGCGDGSLLIYAVKKRKLKRAVGFEDDERIARIAKSKVREAGLKNRVCIIPKDFYEQNLSEADVIFHMLQESSNDLRYYQSKKANIKEGAKLIKHDLPIISYLPDKIDIPFYLMKFPFTKARSKNHWASVVLGEKNAKVSQLWHELYYYYWREKGYTKNDIRGFDSLLSSRFR